MALQDMSALALVGLGVHHDAPPDPIQPPLVDGIHLRWGFGAAKGFPWHGYYLLRRPHRKREQTCLRGRFRGIVPPQWKPTAGATLPLGVNSIAFPEGVFSSDQPLVATDDFPPPGFGELDLRNRDHLRFTFTPQTQAYFVSYAVGLRKSREDQRFRCIQFDERDEREGPNPRRKEEVRFLVRDRRNEPAARTSIKPVHGAYALDLGHRTEIDLPCVADEVVFVVVNQGGAGGVIGLDAAGREVSKADIPRSAEPERIDLRGKGMTRISIVAPQNEMLLIAICYHCVDRDGQSEPIRARAFAGNVLIDEQVVSGTPGDIVQGTFTHDLITAVEFTGGNGALVDLCYMTISADARAGWAPVPKVEQPIALPVRHPSYPASGGVAANQAASQSDAVGRIVYGPQNAWTGAPFSALHGALLDLVHSGPGGPAMPDIASPNVPGVPAVPSSQTPPSLTSYKPLHFVLVASVHAPVAQMLGLYWADQTAVPGQLYDYMVVADHLNVGQHDVSKLISWLAGPAGNFNDVDAWIAYGLEAKASPPLAAPAGLQAYSLPGGTIDQPDGTLRDATNNAGLRWTLPLSGSKLAAGSAVMYRVRRAGLGKTEPAAPIAPAAHQPVGPFPHIAAEPKLPPGATPERASDWPSLPMHYIDGALADGWYSYRLNGVDLFGRYSPQSAPAAWHQWTPAPDPKPWYYVDGLGAGAVHPHAISLLDKRPPPPPPGVEAFALDRRDPLIQRDAAYDAWWATLSATEQQNVLGLRVRWVWTYTQMRQAPDTAEFRVYYQPGTLNMLAGNISNVTPAPPDNSQIVTDIVNPAGANALANLYLRSGGRSFRIVSNTAGSPLTLTVENLAPDHSILPAANQACVISLQPGTALYVDYSHAPVWQARMWVVPYANMITQGVLPAPGAGGTPLAGSGAISAATVVTLPAGTDIGGIRAFAHHIYLADDTARPSRIYLVRAVDAPARQVTLDGSPVLAGGSSDFELGVLMRRYEVFLPASGDADRSGLTLPVSQAEPIAYGRIAVTSVDDKVHTGDDPARVGRWGNRHGNESSVGGPATIFRVHRDPPAPPAMPPDSDAVYASRADYNNNSYYTFRWVQQTNVDTHVFRAMDSTVYARDWAIRETRSALSGSLDAHKDCFPAGWSAGKRNNAANALNAVSGPGSYAGLSADAKEVLGRLPGNEGYASRGGLDARDWEVRRTRGALSKDDTGYFPADWSNDLKRKGAADVLNAIAAPAGYRTLTNDAMRVLAGLPGNEAAFQQVTSALLSNTAAATTNHLGPDNPAGFPIDPTLRAYVDRLDGRSTNRYFYRAAFVDKAQNIGPLGLSSPPVNMPDVVPPRAPTFTRVLAGAATAAEPGDGKITLRWNSNREPDLAAYRVYRTAEPKSARDIRMMDLVQEIAVPAGDPSARPKEVVFVDTPPKALVSYTYRLVAMDTAGNPSAPSGPVEARAFDTALPEVPLLTTAWVEVAGVTRAEVTWNSPHEVLLQRREGGGPWIDLAQWRPPGAVTVRDPFSDPAKAYDYRALARKATGALKRGTAVPLAAQP